MGKSVDVIVQHPLFIVEGRQRNLVDFRCANIVSK
jgi:hypothetical protein